MRFWAYQPSGTGCCGNRSRRLTPIPGSPGRRQIWRLPRSFNRGGRWLAPTMPGPDPDAEEAAASPAELKAYSAEENTAWVRFAVIVFNIAAYWGLLSPAQPGVPALAAFVSVVAMAYAIYLVAARPYRRFP